MERESEVRGEFGEPDTPAEVREREGSRVGGRAPGLYDRRCECCVSPYRDVLDESAVTGVDYRTATSTIPEGERPSPQSWQNHVRLHLFRYDEMFDSARPGARRGVTGRDDGGAAPTPRPVG